MFEVITKIVELLAVVIAAGGVVWGIKRTDKRWEAEKNFAIESKTEQRETELKSLSAALSAEVTGLFEIIEARNYLPEMQQRIENNDFSFHVPLRDRELLPVYVANIQKIGTLGPDLNKLLARNYTILHAILDENAFIAAILDKYGEDFDQEDMKKRALGQVHLLTGLLNVQNELMVKLDDMATVPRH